MGIAGSGGAVGGGTEDTEKDGVYFGRVQDWVLAKVTSRPVVGVVGLGGVVVHDVLTGFSFNRDLGGSGGVWGGCNLRRGRGGAGVDAEGGGGAQ